MLLDTLISDEPDTEDFLLLDTLIGDEPDTEDFLADDILCGKLLEVATESVDHDCMEQDREGGVAMEGTTLCDELRRPSKRSKGAAEKSTRQIQTKSMKQTRQVGQEKAAVAGLLKEPLSEDEDMLDIFEHAVRIFPKTSPMHEFARSHLREDRRTSRKNKQYQAQALQKPCSSCPRKLIKNASRASDLTLPLRLRAPCHADSMAVCRMMFVRSSHLPASCCTHRSWAYEVNYQLTWKQDGTSPSWSTNRI